MKRSTVSVILVAAAALAGGVWWATCDCDKGEPAAAVVTQTGAVESPAAKAPVPPTAPEATAPDPGQPSAEVSARRVAVEAIGTKAVYSAQAEAELVAALAHPDQDVRGHACWGLGRLAPKSSAAVPKLIETLADPVWAVRHNASWALKRFPSAGPALQKALQDTNVRRRVAAACLLLETSAENATAAEPVLLSAYDTADGELRNQILLAMAQVKSPSSAALALLTKVVKEDDTGLFMAALTSLGAWKRAAEPALVVVRGRLKSEDKRVRMLAAEVLGDIGIADKDVVDDLIKLLADGKDRPAFAAAGALARLEAFDALASAQDSPSKRVRGNVAQALTSIKVLLPAHVAMSVKAMQDAEWEVRLAGASALHGHKESPVAAAIPTLVRLMSDANDAVAGQARTVLELNGSDAALKALKAAPQRGGK